MRVFTWIPGPLVYIENHFGVVCVSLGTRHLPTLSLRSIDALRLEGLFAVFLGLADGEQHVWSFYLI